MILALAIFGWSTIARLLRGSILSVREAEYVEAARSLGASRWRIVTRHILPNSFAPVLIFAAFSVGTPIIAEASLSYLGVGVKPDVAEWGNMIAAGQSNFRPSRGCRCCRARPWSSPCWPSSSWATACATPSTRSCGRPAMSANQRGRATRPHSPT